MLNDEFEMQLAKVKQALTNAVAVEIQIKQQLQKNEEQKQAWLKRAAMARSSQHEEMAAQADLRVNNCAQMANELQMQLMTQQDCVSGLKKDLSKLEARRLTAGASSAAALLANSDSALNSLQRFENKIAEHEAYAELSDNSEESKERQLAADTSTNDIESELQALKARAKKAD